MYYGVGCPPCVGYREQMSVSAPKKLIDLILEAMKDERSDRAKYKIMMDMARDPKVKRQINFAYEDEGKHYKMFQQILFKLTGKMTEVPVPDVKRPVSLLEGVESSIDGELEAVELYRDILAMLPNKQMRDMLYEIITDEQEHAVRFTYLYSVLK
ncbi:MAG: hypothetical protein K0R09_343 [Clostridiales bacterium]|nr:hypothetical protein [Clostridiales bacterium]